MTRSSDHPALRAVREAAAGRPLVAAHRGDSRHHPENTLAAFRAATALGVAIQEFDVRQLRCGALVCVHDETFDRTTDSANVLGPGALVAHLDRQEIAALDAGSWFDSAHRGERVPTLAEALAAMLPTTLPLIEHKAGQAERFVDELRTTAALEQVVLQSFDWAFLRHAGALCPDLALAALGPTRTHRRIDAACLDELTALGCAMVHWYARWLDLEQVENAHQRGLLVCTYTTDEPIGWLGGRALGVDAMCTNDPASMRATLAARPWN